VLRSLVDLFIAFTDLLHAYAHQIQESAKKNAIKLGVFAGLGIVGLFMLAGAMVFSTVLVIWSLYLVLASVWLPATAALVTGLIVWLVIGVGAWLAVRQVIR
jgi:hypothetical protein